MDINNQKSLPGSNTNQEAEPQRSLVSLSAESLSAKEMVRIIKELVRDELKKKDATCVCCVAQKYTVSLFPKKYLYDLYVEPDSNNIIHGIPSIDNQHIEIGDYVYLYKIGNNLANAFIVKKMGNDQTVSSDDSDIKRYYRHSVTVISSGSNHLYFSYISSSAAAFTKASEQVNKEKANIVNGYCDIEDGGVGRILDIEGGTYGRVTYLNFSDHTTTYFSFTSTEDAVVEI